MSNISDKTTESFPRCLGQKSCSCVRGFVFAVPGNHFLLTLALGCEVIHAADSRFCQDLPDLIPLRHMCSPPETKQVYFVYCRAQSKHQFTAAAAAAAQSLLPLPSIFTLNSGLLTELLLYGPFISICLLSTSVTHLPLVSALSSFVYLFTLSLHRRCSVPHVSKLEEANSNEESHSTERSTAKLK